MYLFTWLLELIKFIKNGCAKIYRGTEAVYTNEGLNKALLNTYSVVRTVNYTLINGDEVSNSDTSPSYKFKIPAAIFYGSTGYN